MPMNHKHRVTAVCLAFLAGCDNAPPLDPALEQAMETRHEGFETIGESFKTITDTLKAGGSLNPELAESAQTLATLAREIGTWFPPGSGPESGRDTEALPAIWEQPEAFTEARLRLERETTRLAELAQAGDAAAFADQVGRVGESCKNCHDRFRADTD